MVIGAPRGASARSPRIGPTAILWSTLLAAVVVVALAGPTVAPHGLNERISAPFAAPSAESLLGADRLGRDVLSRLLHGGRRVLLIPLGATVLASAVGVPIGLLWASRRRSEGWEGRLLDVVILVPSLLIVLVTVARSGSGGVVLTMVSASVAMPYVTRYTRAGATPVWRRAHVEQAMLRGEARWWVAAHEVLPHMAGPLLADAGLRFAGTLTLVTAMSVLGYGPDPPSTDWAAMILENLSGRTLNLWSVLAPAGVLTALAVSANVVLDRASRRWR